MKLRRTLALAAIAPVYLCSQPITTETPTFRTTARLVTVDVSVTDKRTGVVVEGLAAGNFEIMDQGRPQEIASFSHGDAVRPLCLMLLVDLRNWSSSNVKVLRDRFTAALVLLCYKMG